MLAAVGYFREDKRELGEDMARTKNLQLSNCHSSEVVVAVDAAVVESDVYCNFRSAVRLQGNLGSRLTLSYCIVGTAAEADRKSMLTVVCHKVLVEHCQYRNFPHHLAHWGCWTRLMGTLLKSAFAEEDYIHQSYVDCRCWTNVLRACDRNSVQRWKVWHVNRGVHLYSLVKDTMHL